MATKIISTEQFTSCEIDDCTGRCILLMTKPATRYLQIDHRCFNREQVRDLIARLSAWEETKSLEIQK
jgi:hypothetical protein